MVKVRILVGLAGTSDRPGEVLAVPEALAQQLVAEGRAEFVGPRARRRTADAGVGS